MDNNKVETMTLHLLRRFNGWSFLKCNGQLSKIQMLKDSNVEFVSSLKNKFDDLLHKTGQKYTMSYPVQGAMGKGTLPQGAPMQPKPYPTHSGYPQMPPQNAMMPPVGMTAPPYGNAPPPYTPYPTQPAGYPQQSVTYYPIQPMQSSAYDSGARFDGIARPNVPPPPPGVAPNAAQVAAAQGQPVLMQQRRSDWLEGGSGGGYIFW